MYKPFAYLLPLTLAATGGTGATASPPSEGECEVVRILADGREIRSRGTAEGVSARSDGRSAQASGAASSSGRSSSSSSVSVSSSSTSSGSGHARAVTSFTNDKGHQVTTIRDETGCKITVDERG